jgi:hypothetical protein
MGDAEVGDYLLKLTFLPEDEIKATMQEHESKLG